MIIRGIDSSGDWIFGKGKSDYLTYNSAVAEDIATRLKSFIANCFFDLAAGIDWFNLLGAKSQTSIELAVRTVILNTMNVTGIVDVTARLNANRLLFIQYTVTTSFKGQINGAVSFLTDEMGNTFITEGGDNIRA